MAAKTRNGVTERRDVTVWRRKTSMVCGGEEGRKIMAKRHSMTNNGMVGVKINEEKKNMTITLIYGMALCGQYISNGVTMTGIKLKMTY